MLAALSPLETGLVIAAAILFLIAMFVFSIAWGENARWVDRLLDWVVLMVLVVAVLGLIALAVLGVDLYLVRHHAFDPIVLVFPVCAIFAILIALDYFGVEGD